MYLKVPLYKTAEGGSRELPGTAGIKHHIMENCILIMTRKSTNFFQHKKRKNTKEVYTGWLKSIGKQVDIEAASIPTAEMIVIKIALKEIHKREDIDG